MMDLKATLSSLNQNLNILQEREAKYGGNVPLELLNQINDHKQAIDLTRQAITGELSQADWQEAAPVLNRPYVKAGSLRFFLLVSQNPEITAEEWRQTALKIKEIKKEYEPLPRIMEIELVVANRSLYATFAGKKWLKNAAVAIRLQPLVRPLLR